LLIVNNVIHVQSVSDHSQLVTAIQLVSHSELNWMQNSSSSTMHAVSWARYACMMEVVS